MQDFLRVNESSRTISARELYKELEVTDRFSRWFERMVAYGFAEGTDFTSVGSYTVVNNGAERELQVWFKGMRSRRKLDNISLI